MRQLILFKNCLIFILFFISKVHIVQAEEYFIYQGMQNQYGAELTSRYQKRSSNKSNTDDISEFINVAEVGVRNIVFGYLWRPWFASWSGNNNLRLVQRWQQGDQFKKNSLTGILGQTHWEANMFPVSRFPFKTSFEYSRNEEDRDFEDELVERYQLDFNQRYNTVDNKTSLGANMSFSGRDSNINGTYSEFRSAGNAYHLLNDDHTFSGDMEYLERENDSDNDRLNLLQKNDQLRVFARHRYNPGKQFSMENFSNLFLDDAEYDNSRQRRIDWQLNNNNSWHPDFEPRLSVISNARVNGNQFDIENENNKNTIDLQQFNFYAGAFFDYTKALRFDGNINMNISHSEDTRTANQQRLGINYSPETIKFYAFDYNWFGASSISNNHSEEERFQIATASVGQTLKRELFDLKNSPVSLRINSQFIDEFSTQKKHKDRAELFNKISLNHNYADQGYYSSAQLSFEDRRGFGGLDVNFDNKQTGRLLLSGTYQVGRHRSWFSDLNLQLENEELNNGESSLRYFGTGYIAYNNNRLFDVRRLSFNSRLSLSMEEYLSRDVINKEQLFSDEDLLTTTWENRLTYRIGRLQLNTRLSVSKSEENTNGIIMFEVRRRFGYF